MIDTHSHLNFKAFEKDYRAVIKRSFEREIKGIINVGTRLDNSQKAVEIAQEFAKVRNLGKNLGRIYAAVGFHPDHLQEIESKDIEAEVEKFRELAKHPIVVAIGETGLDNYYFRSGILNDTKENREKAEKVFEAFLKLAAEVDLPVIIHSREAETETLSQLSVVSSQLSKHGVVHCFSGSLEFAKKILELGFYIGFTGIITYPNSGKLQEVVKSAPLDKILIETDSPFLAPQKYRGQRCEPWYVKEIAKRIAEIKGISAKEIEKATTKNAKKLFNLK